ncbi:hypothetical protein XENTR_v10011612 [Xenopus tropicalis]|nr:hypothetical protein XENTR_v10011612 [Xenopus tropicalis]
MGASTGVNVAHWFHGGYHPGHQMGKMAHETGTVSPSRSMGSVEEGLGAAHSVVLPFQGFSSVVALHNQLRERFPIGSTRMEGGRDRRLLDRLGSPSRFSMGSREVGNSPKGGTIQCIGAKSSQTGPVGFCGFPSGLLSKDSHRQHISGILCQETGGNQEQNSPTGGSADHVLGRRESFPHLCSIPSRSRKPEGRLPEQACPVDTRVVPQLGGVSDDSGKVGYARDRSYGNPPQHPTSGVLFKEVLPVSQSFRCPGSDLGGEISVCFSSFPSDPESPPEVEVGEDRLNSHCSQMATQTMVSHVAQTCEGSSMAPAQEERPSISRASVASGPRGTGSSGMETERELLSDLDLPESVVSTLLKARKASTSSAYYRIWEKFISWKSEKHMSEGTSLAQVLGFLQDGLDKGLQFRTLKVHVSALSALSGKTWAENPLVKRFFCAALKIRPPVRRLTPPWSLPLVLLSLSMVPFEPLEEISIWLLTLKTLFLLAIASAARACELQALSCDPDKISFLHDRVVIRPVQSFRPKVTSLYHLKREIVLPIFSVEEQKDKDLYLIDPVRSLKHYLEVSSSFRKTSNLFVIPGGKRKGLPACTSTIRRWIILGIARAYQAQGKQAPEGLKAHSTRAVSSSWAAMAEVPVSEICEVASWSSARTFLKHYRLDLSSSSSHAFAAGTHLAFSTQ